MIKALIKHRDFLFRRSATTSRGTFSSKKVYFVLLYNEENPAHYGIGECSVFPGLSMDDVPGFETKLNEIVGLINKGWFDMNNPVNSWPSINFAIETALKDLAQNGNKVLYPSDFTLGRDSILINGLIWMGDKEDMNQQIAQKLKEGFQCLKLKIGAIDFGEEINIIKYIRSQFSEKDLELRVDANGAFTPYEALEKLKILADFEIHSIEQPILPSQLDAMASLCAVAPLPIALDEELLGKYPIENRRKLLEIIKPQYIVLKPGLLGGISSCEEWIKVANEFNIGWWVTSSLETNIGLSAIAQWTYTLKNPIPQGLSTGNLFRNNITSPLAVVGEKLYYLPRKKWDISFFTFNHTDHEN
jgi:o-succinylbenzoate synthase